ncbi:response regulator [Salegentibacter sediminis]|uniref:response regulator n=1 Tax=Salegentibacter sediminis TaxID=1930251 RepID=UPI0009BEBBE8|nr:response regulator [Salegentibacter sediminis]
MKILLVDDDPMAHLINEKLISAAMDDRNPEIISFYKANKALAFNLQHIRSNSLEKLYIFLDLNMPEFNGWDFLEGLKEFNDNKISVYILTSSISKTDRQKVAAYKFVKDYLVKPLSIPLITKIFNQEIVRCK